MHLKIKLNTNDEALLNLYKERQNHHDDSGFDLFVPKAIEVPEGALAQTIRHNISVAAYTDAGEPTAFFLMPRSSISKTPLRLSNSVGLIDRQYRGDIMAKVDNIQNSGMEGRTFCVSAYSRLFQIVAPDLSPITFEIVDELDETARGSGGFGSTGE